MTHGRSASGRTLAADNPPRSGRSSGRKATIRAPVGRGSEDAPVLLATAGRPVKRSLTIAGHRTSVSLEDGFWQALATIAEAEALPLAALVARIDGERGDIGLSSAIRLHVLAWFVARAARSGPVG
ncbi:MAG: ribbon-helix-helix domain-containing protein [Hyphomicrobiaceae bacterium]